LSNRELILIVHLDPFWIELCDAANIAFLSTPAGQTLEWRGEKAVQRFDLPAGSRIYGLGQGTASSLDLRGQERRMWQQWDGFRYSGNAGIPFLMSSRGYGLLLNSSWASRFAIGQAVPARSTSKAKPEAPWKADQPSGEEHPERLAILTEGGDLDLFIIYGPDYPRILKGYCDLTGYAPLPPRWALGWMQSKNRYKSQEQLLAVGREYRARGIPADVLIIDWCWFERFGYLDWVRRAWPDPEGMLRELKALGFHIMQAQHPFMHADSPHFRDFEQSGHLISWDPDRVADGWPPDGIRHLVDFSNPEARGLWWSKIEPLFRQGIDGYWTDMGEPDTHPPDSSPHYLGPREKVHNIYSWLWSKALYEGQRSVSNQRVFILARTAYAGIQRFGTALWSGDIDPSWEVLEDQVVVGQQVCLSGQPYWTTDIGAFMTCSFYEPELYVRWLEWGAFCPLFRTHGTRPGNEPWSYGPEAQRIITEYIRTRYRLLPYIYSLAYVTSKTGLSSMRAMTLEFPDDQEAVLRDHQYMFGPSMLVAPVTRKGARHQEVWLPAGTWYDYWDDGRYVGPRSIQVLAPLWKLPLFIRGGSIIPQGPEVLHSGASPLDPLLLHVYPGSDAHFTLYEDDGSTYDHEEGAYVTTELAYLQRAKRIEISAARGNYPGFPAARTIKVIGHDFDPPGRIRVNGAILDPDCWKYGPDSRRLELELPGRPTSERLTIEMERTGPAREEPRPLAKAGLGAGYDLETVDPVNGQLLRIYLDNRAGAGPARGRITLQMFTGWSQEALDGEDFAVEARQIGIVRFRLFPMGPAHPASGSARAFIRSAQQEQVLEIPLGSGWASWWNILGPFKPGGPEGFDTIYPPETSGRLVEPDRESGLKLVRFQSHECFGYVNLEKIFEPKDITAMVVGTPEYKLCYSSCTAYAPESRECLLQLMGEDRFKVWINDRPVAIVHECAARPAEFSVHLDRGANRILLKCTQDAHREWNDRAWGFYFRFSDDGRRPLSEVTYALE
jgi:alpha-glucosidase (family GH31 glycosyl hydrolase)